MDKLINKSILETIVTFRFICFLIKKKEEFFSLRMIKETRLTKIERQASRLFSWPLFHLSIIFIVFRRLVSRSIYSSNHSSIRQNVTTFISGILFTYCTNYLTYLGTTFHKNEGTAGNRNCVCASIVYERHCHSREKKSICRLFLSS